MALPPTIDTRTSILSAEEGGSITFLPSATESPTSWSSTTLPPNTTFNTSTGQLDIAPVEGDSGIYSLTITATNQHGSDSLSLLIPIYPAPAADPEPEDQEYTGEITIPITVDIVTGKITFDGAESFDFGPATLEKREEGYRKSIFLAKEGDRFPVAFKFVRNGVAQDLTLRSIRAFTQEFAPDQTYDILESWSKVGTGEDTRYYSVMSFPQETFEGILSNYEEDSGTYLDSLAEVEYTVLASSNDYDTTLATALVDTNDPNQYNRDYTFEFLSFPKVEDNTEATVTLDLDLQSGPDIQLVRNGSIKWDADAGVYVFSSWTGDTSKDNDNAQNQSPWTTTFSHVSDSGDSDSLDITVNVNSDDLNAISVIRIPIEDFAYVNSISDGFLNLDASNPTDTFTVDVYDNDLSTGAEFTVNINDGDAGSSIKTAFTSSHEGAGAVGEFEEGFMVSVVLDEEEQDIVFYVDLTKTKTRYSFSGIGADFASIIAPSSADDVYISGGTVSATLEADAVDDIHRRTTETFIFRIEKDRIEDI